MSNPELVSVIIPCYNQAHFLGEAIESVLAQSYQFVEIIVVDDGSTDNTAQLATSFEGVRCLSQSNMGLAGARNAGLSASSGTFVVFLDADDRLLPNSLQDGVSSLRANPECAFVYGHVNLIASDGSALSTPRQVAVRENHYLELLRHNYIWTTGAAVYRRSALDAIGGFDAAANGSADFDLNARIARVFPICCTDKTVLEYRRHRESMSRDCALMLRNAVAVRRRHRRLISGNRANESALHAGIQSAQADYGEKLIEVVGRRMRQGEWKSAALGLRTLLRYYPQGVFKRARRKLTGSVLHPQS